MKALWSLTIEYDPANMAIANTRRVLASHIFVSQSELVEELGRLAGLPVAKNNCSPRRVLRIELFEDDPRLNLLVRAIGQRLGYAPGPWFITPPDERHRFYSPRRTRQYSEEDLDQARFLCLDFAGQCIATHSDGTVEQVDREIYAAIADHRQYTKTQFGTLMPFHGLCVSESLARQLERTDLRGLCLEPVVFQRKKRDRDVFAPDVFVPQKKVRKPLKKLGSSRIAPRCLLPVVNEQGYRVEPNTEWSCYLDDAGYVPHEFKYDKADWEFFQRIDIAMSYERTGVTKARAYRWCLVSQRFRQVMAELKVPGLQYAPVRFVEE